GPERRARAVLPGQRRERDLRRLAHAFGHGARAPRQPRGRAPRRRPRQQRRACRARLSRSRCLPAGAARSRARRGRRARRARRRQRYGAGSAALVDPRRRPGGAGVELTLVRAATGEHRGAATRAERNRIVHRPPLRERICESCRKAVSAAVRVLDRPGRRDGAEGPTGPDPAAERAGRRDDEARRRLELSRVETLARVLAAPDHDVQLLLGPTQRRQLAGACQVSSACTISPGSGTWSTRANSTHSTCPTTARFMPHIFAPEYVS